MRLEVVAHPNAKIPRIEIDLLNTFHVYVHEPALEGKANKAVVKSLIKHFKTNNVSLINGQKSKNKVFDIS